MKRLLLVAVALALVPAAASAQVDRATLTGVVRDASGAVVPKATVQVTHLASNVVTSVETTESGTYLAVNLAPGEYLVEAGKTGFQKLAQTVRLEVGQRAQLDFSLAVGDMNETVKVEGVTPLLDTGSGALGQVVTQVEVAKLPLAIRNWDDLLALVPGVQGDRYTEESGGTATGRTGSVSVHGSRTLQNNFLLDGVDNNSFSENVQELSTQISRPSVDAISEFKVVTSPYAAEFGRAPGGTVSLTTKSGSNAFHGTTYDYYRNDRFDANTFFAKLAGRDKPTNDQNQFGGNLGGPVVKNQVFFFGDYEGTRITKGVLRTGRVMTDAERNGIFSTPIKDPLTGLPFANNTISAGRIDPVARNILALLPSPNAALPNNFIRQPDVSDDSDRYLGRVDVRLSGNDNVFGRYIYTNRTRFVPGWFGGILDGTSTSAWGRNYLKSNALVGGWTKVLSGALVNELRVSWARARSDGQQDPFGADGLAQIGFTGVPADPTILGGIVGVDITGHIRLGSPNFMPKFQHTDQFQYVDTLSWLRGRHSLKFGADIMAPMKNQFMDIPSTRGNLGFTGQFTGNAFADFLLGYARSAELSNVYVVNQRLWSTAFFAQDDWRITDKLTLNLGLRYDFMTPAYERDNHLANFDPATGTLIQAKDGSLADRALVTPDKNNFAPRLAAVYKLNEKTLVRGGYGIFYNLFDRIGSEDQLSLNPPGLRNISLTAPAGNTPVLLLQNGFPSDFLDPSHINLSRLLIRSASSDGARAMVHQFSGGLERQLTDTLVVSADVVGTLSRNLAVLRNLNQQQFGNVGPRPYPAFAHIQWREPSGDARYRGLDLSLEKRFSSGYSYRVSYTIGSSVDQAPEHLSATSGRPQNSNDLEAWRGPSDFDVRNRLVGDAVVELPFGQGRKWLTDGVGSAVLGGWTASAIYTYRSGRPYTVTQGSLEGAAWVPNRVGDGTLSDPTYTKWFDVTAFEKVPNGVFGSAGRNPLVGPDWMSFDMSLQKRVRVTDSVGVQLRWDVFNLFNRTNFGQPDSNITSATAGVISTLAGDPRITQFALRVEF
jgi:outer membrane receptor protein involved in Fe transport